MFEYIKRVSVAINFIAQKIDSEGFRIKNSLEGLSLELLLIAQNFRNEEAKLQDLRKLEDKICYLVDLVDFARINNFVSMMNAKIFTDSMISFLKHVVSLIEQKNALSLPVYHLKELDEVFARKSAKENLQNKFSAENIAANNFNFSDLQTSEKNFAKNSNQSYQNIVTSNQKIKEQTVPGVSLNKLVTEVPEVSEVFEEPVREIPKKVLEESVLYPHGSLESVEHEIEQRRLRILKTLTLGGGSIREISAKLKDINEKTIQRDLLELMRDKKVIMLGKKRWAKYYLK